MNNILLPTVIVHWNKKIYNICILSFSEAS